MSEANLMKDEIDELLKTNNINQRHSYFQLKYFLIGKEPTLQSKMWQCLRELKTRSESLKNIVLENDDLKDKIEILEEKITLMEKKIEKQEEFRRRITWTIGIVVAIAAVLQYVSGLLSNINQ
jgi:hypothetical protein